MELQSLRDERELTSAKVYELQVALEGHQKVTNNVLLSRHTARVLELLMVKRDILHIPDNFLNNRAKDVNNMLSSLCTSWC